MAYSLYSLGINKKQDSVGPTWPTVWLSPQALSAQWIFGGNRRKKNFLINPFSSIGQIIWVVADTTAKKLAKKWFKLKFLQTFKLAL